MKPHLVTALQTILAAGGVWEHETHSGRNRKGMVRKLDMAQLERLGYVRAEHVEDPARARYADVPHGVTKSWRWFASAKGCIALYNHETAVAVQEAA